MATKRHQDLLTIFERDRLLQQVTPSGTYTFETWEEGIVDVAARMLMLKPFRATATQGGTDATRDRYANASRELVSGETHLALHRWQPAPAHTG